MISFRYHLVSLVAVLLALAVGIVAGTSAMNGPVLSGLRSQVADLTKARDAQQQAARGLRQRVARDEEFAAAVAPAVVAGRLAHRTVVVVAAENAGAALTDGVQQVLRAAGAAVTGRVQLLPGYADPRRAAELRSYVTGGSLPPGLQLPETDDAGVLGATLLADLLVSRGGAPVAGKDAAQVFAGLASLQMVRIDGHTPGAADLAVVVTGGAFRAADRVQSVTDLASALDRAGRGTVLVGDLAAAGRGGAVAAVRADQGLAAEVSTVDSVDTAAGQIATVYALAEQAAGRAGHYGLAPSADATVPAT